MNEWGCGLYSGVGNPLTFVSFCDKNMGVQVICGAGYSPENTVYQYVHDCIAHPFELISNSFALQFNPQTLPPSPGSDWTFYILCFKDQQHKFSRKKN